MSDTFTVVSDTFRNKSQKQNKEFVLYFKDLTSEEDRPVTVNGCN